MTTLGSNNPFPSVLFANHVDPSTPGAGTARLFVDTDKVLKLIDEDGTVTEFSSGGVTDHGALTGLSDDDHTQYVLRSILTTNGDLFTRAAGAISRLGIGSDGDVLTVASGAPSWAAPTGGGGGFTGALPIQDKGTGAGASGSSRALTLNATPANGNLLLALISVEDGTKSVSSISQTNVTWTKIDGTTAGTTPVIELWKGVVSASASTSVTVNYSGATYNGVHISEWPSTFSGTVVQSAKYSNRTIVSNVMYTPEILPTDGANIIIGGCTTSNNNLYRRMIHGVSFTDMFVTGSSITASYAFPGTAPFRMVPYDTAAGGTMSALIAEIS